MFTTAKQATQAAMQQATAFGLAALVTLSVLASINQLASAPTPNSLLAANSAQQARS